MQYKGTLGRKEAKKFTAKKKRRRRRRGRKNKKEKGKKEGLLHPLVFQRSLFAERVRGRMEKPRKERTVIKVGFARISLQGGLDSLNVCVYVSSSYCELSCHARRVYDEGGRAVPGRVVVQVFLEEEIVCVV